MNEFCPDGSVPINGQCIKMQEQPPAETSLPDWMKQSGTQTGRMSTSQPKPRYPVDGYEEGSTTFIATFGSGQVHDNGYCEIQADNLNDAYEWMSTRYHRKWASMYGHAEGQRQILSWGYQMVCKADIRGDTEQVTPVNEFIVPPDMKVVGEIQPILRTPGMIRLYYHYGVDLEDKLDDARRVGLFIRLTGRELTGIVIGAEIFSSYTDFQYKQKSVAEPVQETETYILKDVTHLYFPREDDEDE